MDPGRDPTADFFLGLIDISTVNIIDALSNLVPVYKLKHGTVVQYYTNPVGARTPYIELLCFL